MRRGGVIEEISADTFAVGDAVLVNPGALVPLDGAVIAGSSFVDEDRITGEPMPAEKVVGSIAYAGTVNQRVRLISATTVPDGTSASIALSMPSNRLNGRGRRSNGGRIDFPGISSTSLSAQPCSRPLSREISWPRFR